MQSNQFVVPEELNIHGTIYKKDHQYEFNKPIVVGNVGFNSSHQIENPPTEIKAYNWIYRRMPIQIPSSCAESKSCCSFCRSESVENKTDKNTVTKVETPIDYLNPQVTIKINSKARLAFELDRRFENLNTPSYFFLDSIFPTKIRNFAKVKIGKNEYYLVSSETADDIYPPSSEYVLNQNPIKVTITTGTIVYSNGLPMVLGKDTKVTLPEICPIILPIYSQLRQTDSNIILTLNCECEAILDQSILI